MQKKSISTLIGKCFSLRDKGRSEEVVELLTISLKDQTLSISHRIEIRMILSKALLDLGNITANKFGRGTLH